MAKDYKTIIKITDEEKNKIIDNSPKNLPLNPSAQGYSGAEIRKRLYQSTVGEDGSLLALLERLVDVLTTELNAIETDKADVSYADSGLSLKADKTYVDSKLGLKTDKTYVDTELDKKVDKTVYELAINDLENNKLSVITFNSEKNTMTVYVDTKANTAKSEAQSYADTKDASVLLEAKAYTDTKIADVEVGNLTAVYKFKGSVANYTALPATDLVVGDVYDVKDTGMNYAWNGTDWDALGSFVDLSDYYSKDETFSQEQVSQLLDSKVDKVSGKGLSSNDYTTIEKNKLAGIEAGAEVNVQSDWNITDTTNDAFIKNKPVIKTVATTGDYGDLINKPDLALKLDKNFSALPTQASPLLTDVLAINRGTVAQKVTLGNVLAQVDAEIFIVTTTLPATGVVNKIYLVPKGTPEAQNTYDEFIWVNSAWEKLGTIALDLSNYYNKTEVNGLLSAKVDKNNTITAGTKAKITYDSKGLVTAGADLTEADIPTLSASKITQDANNRFVTDAEKSTWNGKQNALTAGDGISISGNIISANSGLAVEEWNTATKTLALSDANKLFLCASISDQTLTIPTHSSVPLPIGTMITFLLTHTNTVTFSGQSGIALTSMDGSRELVTQYGMASLIKVAVDTWQLDGVVALRQEVEDAFDELATLMEGV